MSVEDFQKLSVESKLNVIYTELLIIKNNQDDSKDTRPIEVQTEFPLREFSLNECVCGHGSEDHTTELGHVGVKDGTCEKCTCREFRRPMKGEKKK